MTVSSRFSTTKTTVSIIGSGAGPIRWGPRLDHGFTLIELLVVMSMLSLIMIGLVQAFRTLGQTERSVDQRLTRTDQIRVTRQFLDSVLSRVDATKVSDPLQRGNDVVLFQADPTALSWVGIMPARPGVGGRYFMRLAIEPIEGGDSGLVLRYLPWGPAAALPDFSQAPMHVLLASVVQFEVRAQGLPRNPGSVKQNWPYGWQTGWPVRNELPQRVMLRLQDRKGDWPPMTVGLLPTVSSVPENSGFVTGGGRR